MTISTVTSEALQQKIRELLPSQQGFGTDLSASDTIIPIVDLTEAASGSSVAVNLQTAIAFGSITDFSINNTTTLLANTVGFWRFYGILTIGSSSGNPFGNFTITDGAATKTIFLQKANNGTGSTNIFDFVVFLRAGDSVSAQASNTLVDIGGNYRQIADSNGVLVNPSGFSPQ